MSAPDDTTGILTTLGLLFFFLLTAFVYFFTILVPAPLAASAATVTDAQAAEDLEGTKSASSSSRHLQQQHQQQPRQQQQQRRSWLGGCVNGGSSSSGSTTTTFTGAMAEPAVTFPHSLLGLALAFFSLSSTILLVQWMSSFKFFLLELRVIVFVLMVFFVADFALTIWFFSLVLRKRSDSAAAVVDPESLTPSQSSSLPSVYSGLALSPSASRTSVLQRSPLGVSCPEGDEETEMEASNEALMEASPKTGTSATTSTTSGAQSSPRQYWRRVFATLSCRRQVDTFFLATVGVCSILNCGNFSLITLRAHGSPLLKPGAAPRVTLLATIASVPLSLVKGSLLSAVSFVLYAKLGQWNLPLLLGLLGGVGTLLSGLLESAVLLRHVLDSPSFNLSPSASSSSFSISSFTSSTASFEQNRTRSNPAEVIFSTLFLTASVIFFILEITHLHLPSLFATFAVCVVSFLLWFNSLLPGLSPFRYLQFSRVVVAGVIEGWYYIMVGCLILAVGASHLDPQCPWKYPLLGLATLCLPCAAFVVHQASKVEPLSQMQVPDRTQTLKDVWRPTLLCLFVVLFVWLLPLYVTDPELTWDFVRDMTVAITVTSLFWLGVAAWFHTAPRVRKGLPSHRQQQQQLLPSSILV